MKNDSVMEMLKVTPVTTGVCHGALVWVSVMGFIHRDWILQNAPHFFNCCEANVQAPCEQFASLFPKSTACQKHLTTCDVVSSTQEESLLHRISALHEGEGCILTSDGGVLISAFVNIYNWKSQKLVSFLSAE